MGSSWFWASGTVSLLAVFMHVVFGGKLFVRPFLENELLVCAKAGVSPKTLPAIPMFSAVAVLGALGLLR